MKRFLETFFTISGFLVRVGMALFFRAITGKWGVGDTAIATVLMVMASPFLLIITVLLFVF